MAKNNWIQGATNPSKHGALHRQLGLPLTQKIPITKLRKIVKTPIGKKVGKHKVTRLLKERANFALNTQKQRKRK